MTFHIACAERWWAEIALSLEYRIFDRMYAELFCLKAGIMDNSTAMTGSKRSGAWPEEINFSHGAVAGTGSRLHKRAEIVEWIKALAIAGLSSL